MCLLCWMHMLTCLQTKAARANLQGKLQVNWVDTKGNMYQYVLNKQGQVIIPRGAAHSLRNVTPRGGSSINLSVFNSELPGTSVSST